MRKIDSQTYQPLGWRVLVRDEKVEDKTRGGIYIPDSAKTADEHAQQFGVVVRCGYSAFRDKDGRRDPFGPEIGDVVNYWKYSGGCYYEDEEGHKYRILNDDEILGVVERRTGDTVERQSILGRPVLSAFDVVGTREYAA